MLGFLVCEYSYYRFVTALYPSAEDDVITSPYNSILAMRELTEHADCVLPVENQASEIFVQESPHVMQFILSCLFSLFVIYEILHYLCELSDPCLSLCVNY